jgi:hypothetical protein
VKRFLKHIHIWLGMVAHACNTSYSGDRDHEGQGSRQAWAKVRKTLISINKLGVMAHICDHRRMYGRCYLGRRSAPDKNIKSYLKKK